MLSLLLPLVVYNILLKVLRIFSQEEVPGALGFLDQVRSDLLFNLGYVALWVGLFTVFRKGAPRWIVLAAFHVSTLIVVLLTTSAHFYYETTGSSLSLNVISLSISSFGEIQGVIASEVQAWMIWLISAVLFYVIAGPAVITRLAQREWYMPTWSAGSSVFSGVAVFAAAFVLAGLSILPGLSGASNSFSRDALVNMFVTEVEKVAYADVKPDTSKVLAGEQPPTGTKLVGSGGSKRNVVMVYMESTRARSTTPFDARQQALPPEEQITPFLQRLSESSLMAEDFNAVVPHTSKSLTASHCGIAPPMDQNNTESDENSLPSKCIPELLDEAGYDTAYFQSATQKFERRDGLVENFGYDEFYPLEALPKEGYDEVNYFGYEDDIMLNPSRQWLGQDRDQPFLASYLTVGTHHDYGVPPDFEKKRYVEDDILNDYLNALHYQDQFLQKLFQQYREMGLYEDTIFVIVGDHGEAFGEHGRNQHDNIPYDEGTRVPFLVHDPQNPRPERYEAPANHTDILPTLMDKLGYRIDGGEYPGISLLGPEREDRVHRMSCYQPFTCLMSIEDGEKYIYNYGNEPAEYYDLSEDPREQNNIAKQQSEEKLAKRREDLLSWRAGVDKVYEEYRGNLKETTNSTIPEGTALENTTVPEER
jgi:phosphoglycerol transferase MdoB-like AlkP superfamily enzyme